jgi:hypothetical protein
VRRNLILSAILTLAVLVGAFAHVWLRGKHAMEASDQALSKGDPRAAITSAKEAAQSKAPFSPYPGRGKQRLREIAQNAEERADFDMAVIAFRALRAVCTSTSVGRPEACADEADLGLERIAARSGIPSAPKEDDTSPPVWLPIAVMIGLIGLVVAANRVRSPKS